MPQIDADSSNKFDFKRLIYRFLALQLTFFLILTTFALARITRAAMLEVLGQDFIRTAKAKGMSMYMVYLKHALKNAAIPLLTVLGLQFGLLLGGAIITETVFSWPGIGSWLLDSVNARDYPALEIGILVTAASFVVVNTIVDLLYSLFDPRVRVG
jgi:peptide/nickel transport system permease protein